VDATLPTDPGQSLQGSSCSNRPASCVIVRGSHFCAHSLLSIQPIK
jgi:hypothetical protein